MPCAKKDGSRICQDVGMLGIQSTQLLSLGRVNDRRNKQTKDPKFVHSYVNNHKFTFSVEIHRACRTSSTPPVVLLINK